MVYCGKPSKGCGACRSRKIRCDQVRPTCSQCAKARRACPGYRDELALMFRDESKEVVRKAKAGTSGRKSKATKEIESRSTSPSEISRSASPSGDSSLSGPESIVLSDFNDDLQSLPLVQRLESPPVTFQPTYSFSQDEAVCFFLRYNAFPGAFWMDHVADLFLRIDGPASKLAMKSSIVAVGTAMLSRARKSPSLILAAEREYGSALKLMNAAVSNKVDARSHPTLAAVLLLAMFEIITSRAPSNIENWTNHIRGAVGLLELRGVEQLQTAEGLKLFMQLRFQIIISCLQRDSRVPEKLVECSRIAMFLRPQVETFGDRLITIVAKVANLRADVISKTITDSTEILTAAYGLEAELTAWVASLAPHFQYDTYDTISLESWSRSRGIPTYGHQYHVYRELWVCNLWNQYRGARLIVCELIMSSLRRVSEKSGTETWSNEVRSQRTSIRVAARQLALDISASIPFHFGAAKTVDPSSDLVPDNETHIGGMMVLWPLFLAGTSEAKGHPLRNWVMGCMKIIGHTMGVDQALALIEIMEYMDAHDGFFGEIDREDNLVIQEALASDDLTSFLSQQTSPLDCL